MKRGLTLVLALLLVVVFAVALTSCKADEHEHTYSDKWEIDENNHWHKATCEHADKISSKGGHIDADKDGACDMCGNGEVHMHTYTDAWTSDETGHWHMATCEGHTTVKGDVYKHVNENGDGVCDLCGYAVAYSVEVTAPKGVDAPAVVYVDKATGTATFEASVMDLYVLSATGATQKGEAENKDGENIYTFELKDVKADGEVTLASKQVKFAKVVAEDTTTITFGADMFGWGARGSSEITLTLEAGTYVLAGTSEEGVNVSFMDSDFMTVTTFTAQEAGEYTFTVAGQDVTGMGTYTEGDEVEIDYAALIVPTTSVSIDALEGDGLEFPSAQEMEITFTAPEAGMYVFTSSNENVIWNYDIAICTKYVSEAGETVTVTVSAPESEDYTYDFDWKVEKIAPSGAFVDGETVTLNFHEYTVLEFTATEKGTYNFSVLDSYETFVVYYDYEYGFMYNASFADMELDEGDKVVLYIENSDEATFDGADTITETLVVDFTPALPSFELTTTDNYTYADEYTFTATVSGAYTFYIPAGLGWITPEAMENWGEPIVDYNDNENGYEYTIDLAEGAEFTFLYGSTIKNETYVVEYSVVEGEVGGGNGGTESAAETPLTVPGNNGVNMADVVYAYTATENGTLKLTIGNAIMGMVSMSYTINDGDSQILELGTEVDVAMNAGDKIVITVEAEGYSSIGATWVKPAGANTPLTIGNNAIDAADVTFAYTATEAGTLKLTVGNAIMGMVEITYTVNGGESQAFALESNVDLTLQAGDEVVITVVAEGYATITAAWEVAA